MAAISRVCHAQSMSCSGFSHIDRFFIRRRRAPVGRRRITRIAGGRVAVLAALLTSFITPAWSEQPLDVDTETKAAWASVFDGHVNDGISRVGKVLAQTDPT